MAIRQYRNLGPYTALAGGLQIKAIKGSSLTGGLATGLVAPKSGITGVKTGNGVGLSAGTVYVNTATNVIYINEGTAKVPYWTPVDFTQRGLMGWYADGRDLIGKANADTAATATVTGSGLRIFGDQVIATDSGLVWAVTSAGIEGTLQASATSSGNIALGFGGGGSPVGLFKPNANGTFVVDAFVAQHTAKTLRSMFVGFCAVPIDALQTIATGSGTTITFRAGAAGNDCVGLYADSALTDAFGNWFGVNDNAGGTATQTTVSAATGVATAAVEVYQRLRVEVDADGGSRLFINKALVKTNAAATNAVTVALSPVIVLQSTSAATKVALVKQFASWGNMV